jgi:hypothetical protein
MHASQAACPALAWKVPTEQSVQLAAPAAEYFPASHAAVTALRPAISQNEPAVHDLQELSPVVTWKVPAAQSVHAPAEAPEYWPDAQFRQPEAPAEAKEPESQAPETTVRPASAQYDPAVHATHELWPTLAWKVPAEQSEQLAVPAVEYLPAPHAAVTALRPLISQYDPAVHKAQKI